MDDLFPIEGLLIERQYDGVGDHVIHVRRPAGPGVAEVMRLHRRRTIAQDLRPRVLGVSGQIDRDVNAQLADEPCRFDIVA